MKAFSSSVKEYCNYNRKIFKNNGDYKKGLILVDCFLVPQWIMVNSILLNQISKLTGAAIATYDINRRNFYSDKIFSSFGANIHLKLRLSRKQRKRTDQLFKGVILSMQSKSDLHNLTLEGVKIGTDIYESILKTGVPTVDIKSFLTYRYIYQGLCYFVYFQEMLMQGKIVSVVLSHDCYIKTGILEKLAYFYSVPVYFANIFEIVRPNAPYQIHEKFHRYPEYFNVLSDSEKEIGLKKANSALARRLKGDIGVNMKYQSESAFTFEKKIRQTNDSRKIKLLITTHCFFDNPQAYGGILFIDFYEWLVFLGEISKKTNYEWYLKPHRDYRPGTLSTLKRIIKKYPAFKLVDPETTFHQLREEGVTVALTCYGSVGHELPELGYHVINAGYNPHIAYNFNIHCSSIKQYEKYLLNLKSLPNVSDIDRLLEFYYIHYFIIHRDNYFFDSFEDYAKYINNDFKSLKCFDYFMKNSEKYVNRFTLHVDEILVSNFRYSYELDIEKKCMNNNFKPIQLEKTNNKSVKPEHVKI
jgi:hypothetical protein